MSDLEVTVSERLLLRHATEFRFDTSRWRSGSDRLCVRLSTRGEHWTVCMDCGRGFAVLYKNKDGELGFNGPGQHFFYDAEEVALSRDQAIAMALDLADGRVKARDP